MSLTAQEVERASEIVDEMLNLLDEFEQIVRQSSSSMLMERFRSYPKGHIQMSLTKNSDYLGSNPFPLSELVEAMTSEVESLTCVECDEVLPDEDFSDDDDGDGICNKCRHLPKE